MPRIRPTRRVPRGARYLVPGVVAAALLVAPGTAWAAAGDPSPTDPLGGVVQQGGTGVGQVVGGLTGTGTTGTGDTAGTGGAGTGTAGTATPGTDTTGTGNPVAGQAAPPSPPPLPPQLQTLLDSLNPSPACSAAIQADVTKLLTDIPGSITAIITALTPTGGQPPTSDQIIGALEGALGVTPPAGGAAAPAAAAPAPPNVPIVADLQQLGTDLTTTCKPAVPTPPPSTGTNNPPATNAGNPSTPTQQAAQPQTAQPVSYPGYAATGAIAPASSEHPVDPAPLAALAGGVLLVSGAATAAVRSRARRAGR